MVLNNVIFISLGYLIGISLILLFNEINYRWFHVKEEYSRKMAHVVATLATLPFPYLFSSHWYILILAILFFGVLKFTQGSKHLNSIHGVGRRSLGSYLLPVSIYIVFLIYTYHGDPLMYILPIAILAICDPMAALVGISWKGFNKKWSFAGHQSDKTVIGSLAFFLSSGLISILLLSWFFEATQIMIIPMAIAIGLVSTFSELFSWRGSDNLTIPLSVQFVMWLLIN